ncbi:MBG domain-containing protein [Limosilactobacillus reuteri]|uniref:MBG domain-containing protein n=1 Tax=Limosilactobacillus reuteri TaxID=1598 RepID=UPI0039903EBA
MNDPAKLTDDEKGQVSAGITKANPDAPIKSITVNDDGSANVTFNDGSTKTVPSNVVQTDKSKYTVAAGQPVTLTHGQQVKEGDSLDSSAVTLKDAKGQTVSLPDGAHVVWTKAPDTSEVGDAKTGQAKVVYGDKSESEPVTVTYNVTQNDADRTSLKPGKQVKVDDPANLTDSEKAKVKNEITKANPNEPITNVDVKPDGSANVTFNDGSTKTVPSNVVQTDKSKYTVAAGKPVTLTHGQQVKEGDSLDSSAVTLKDAKGQAVSLPDGANVVWTTAPDTSEVGNDKTGQAKVVYGDQTESESVTVTYNVTQNDADRADLKPGKDKAKVTATIGGSITRKYNGQAVNGTTVYGQITWTGKDTSNNQDFTLKHDISASDYSWYTMGKDGQYVKFDGKPTNAGTYYLILNKDYINKLDQANPNYDITKVDGAFTYIINKATATLNLAGSQDANYNGQSIAINYGNFPLSIKTSNDLTLTLPSGKSLDAGDVEITDANGNKVTAPTAIGTYTIKLTQAGLQKFESQTDNYAWASDGSATLTITRNDHVSVTLTNNADGAEIVVYTGKTAAIDPSKFTVTLGNGLTYQLKAGDLQFVDQTAGANTNVGTYQVELSQQGKANIAALEAANYGYDFSKAGNGTVTVTKATPTVTLNCDAEKTYDGTSIADYVPTITIKAPGTNSVTLTTGDFEWVKDGHIYTTAPSDAGTYTAELTEQGLNKLKAVNATNLDWSKITSVMGGTYKIDKAKVNATLSGNSETKTPSLNAGDYTLDLTVSGKQQTITLTNDDLVLSQNGQAVNQLTKAGTYDVKFSQKFMDYLNSTYPSGNYDVNTSSNAIFTLDNSSQTINYVDANGKVIGSTNVGGDAIEGTTVPFDSQDHVPAGWVITNPSAAPKEVTLENGTTTIAIQHGTITVRPGEKAPTGKVPGDPSKTYAKMDDLTKTPTRTIIVAIPGETTPRTIPQSVTFERSATYDTVTGKATYSDWTTGDTKSWAKVDPTLKGYTTIIDNQPGATIPAVTDITEQTVNVTINVTYVKNAATITISGPAQSKTYDGQAAEITDEIANKISHQISGDLRLTLPDGSQVTLTKDDFSFAGPKGNILTGNPSSVGTYHIVLNKNGLYKIEGLDSNFTWSYDPQTSYVVYTINSAQAGSVAFNASATKTYDSSNVLNGASFTTQPSIVIKGADGKPLAGTKGYTFQSDDFEFVDSKGNVTLATIDSAGQITGPTNAGTYTIQLTQAGLNRIEAANPNVDFSNVKLADIGTGTLTINQYAPTLNLAGNGKKTYDGQTVTSAELIKSDKYNNITITFTVPKQGGGTTTVTYIFNPEMDYTGDYDWYDNGAQIAAPKNAGTYTIQLKADQVKNIFNDLLSKDANYSYLKGNINTDKLRVSGKATYTINKKPLTVYLTGNGGMTYNGSGATMPLQDLLKNLTAEGLVGKETLGTFTFDDADFQWYVKNADGTYSVFNGKDAQGHSVQTPINVGTYYIGILPETSTNSGIDTLKRDNSNYDVTIDYSKYYQFDIKKAQGTATLSGSQTDTYNGQAHTINGYTLTVSGTGIQDGQTVTLNAGDLEFNVKGQWTTNVPVNAGKYQVRLNAAKLAELEKNYPNLAWDNDHVTNSALDYIVNPTQVTVSFTSGPSHSTYNGSALNIEYTKDFFQGRFAMNGVVAGQTLNFPKINSGFFEWVDASGNVMTSVPINAGTYTLKVKDLNELNDLNPNYQLVFSKDTNGNDQNGWTWVIDKATARINFTSDSQTTPWTGKATVLDPNNFAVTITTDNGQALTSDALTVDDFQFYTQAGQAIDIPTEVGNYTIKLKAAGLAKIKKDTANYVWTNIASGNYEITKAAATIKLYGNSSMTYNGQAASFPVNADGSLNGYTVTLSNGQTYTLKPGDLRFSTMVTGADGKSYLEVTNAPVNAGTYDVTLSDNGLANINKVDGSHYQYTLDSSTATFTINKADATIAINGSGKHTYDGQVAKTSEGNYTIQLPGQSTTTNVAADDLVFVDANGKVITAPTNAGTYTIALSDAYKQSLQGTYGNNYNLNYTNGTFTVAPKVVDLILNGTASQFYDGQPAKITDVSGLTLTWGDHTTITAPGGVKFTLTPDDLEVVDGQGNVPTKANEADQATNPYYIKLKDAVLAGLNSQNKNYTFKIGDTYARYTIFAKESNVKLTGKQFVNYGDNPMPAINIQDGNFKLTWTDASGKDQDITLTADDLTVEVPDGVSKDKYGLPTKAGQYVVKLKQGVIDNAENPNYHLSNDPNTNAWYVVKHRQVSFTINGTPSSTYNGQAAQIKDGNYSISFGPVSGNQNSGVLSDDQSAFNGIKWDAGDFEFVNGAPTNAGTYQVRLSKIGLQKLSEFAQGATGSNYDFSSVATIENGQITASSVTANYTINKNQLDISLTNKNGQVPSSIIGDYNLNADDYTLTITPKNTTVYDKYGKPLSFTYKLQNNDVFYVKGLPSNVGTYSVQLTAEALQKIEQQFGTDNFDYNPSTSASREITQGNAVITVSGGQTVYYNGKPAVLRHKKYQVTVSTDFFSTGVSLNKGYMAKMVFYIKNADGSYTELTDESGKPVKPTNAGTYYVGLNSDMVKMLEDATGNEGQNYKWTFNYAPYVIKSVNRTAIGNFSNNSNYNGQAIALQTITVTTKYPGATNTTYTLQNGDYEYVKDGQVVASPTDAGTYTIRLTTAGENHIKQLGNVEGAEENNVNWTIQFTGSYTINQVRMTVTVNGTQNETYDGTAKTINIGGKNGINVTLSDDGLTVPTIPTTGENALTAADFTIKDAAGNIVTNPTNAGHYKVYLNATGLAKLGKLSPNFTVPASLDQAGDLNIARKEVSVTEDSAWKTFDAQSAALTDDQFAHYKDAIINAGKDAGIKDGYSVDGLTIDGIDWWFDDTVDYGTQGSMKNPIKDIGIYNLRLNAKGQRELDVANPNYKIKVGDFQYHIYPEVVHIELSGNQDANWDNQPVPVNPTNFVPTFVVYGGPNGKNPGPDDKPLKNPVRDDGQPLTLPAGVQLEPGDYEFVDVHGKVIKNFTRADGTTSTNPFKVGTYYVRLTEAGWMKLAILSTDNVKYQYNGSTGTLNINSITPQFKLNGQNWKTYDGQPVSYKELTSVDPTTKQPLVTVSITSNEHTITFPLNDGDYVWSANGQALTSAPTNVGTYTITLNKDKVMKSLQNFISSNSDYQGAMNILADNIGGSALFEIKALQIANITADPSSDSKTYDGTAAQIDLSTLAKSIKATTGSGKNEKVWSLNTSNLTLVKDYTVTDAKGNVVTDFPINAGTYTFKLNDQGIKDLAAANTNFTIPSEINGYSYIFTINPVEAKAVLSGQAAKTYDGNQVTTAEINAGTSTVTVSINANKTVTYVLQDGDYIWYVKNADGSWTKLDKAPIDAGTYKVEPNNDAVLAHLREKIADDPEWTVGDIHNVFLNDSDLSGSAEFTIKKKPVTLIISDNQTSTADPIVTVNPQKITVSGNGITISNLKADDFQLQDIDGNVVKDPKLAGKYIVALTPAAQAAIQNGYANYQFSFMGTGLLDVQAKLTINFVDTDEGNKVIQTSTKSGDAGTPLSLSLTLPAGYQLADGQTLPTSYQFTDALTQTLNINLKHATQSVEDSKTVTRTINYTDPTTGEVKTLTTQPVTLTRTGSTDLVTHKTTWQDWTTGNWAAISANDIPTFAGYTPSQTSVAAETVTGQTSNSTVNITYTANDQSTHIIYQDAKGNTVKTDTVSGKTDQTVDTNSSLPTGWKITETSKVKTIPSTITFKGVSTPDTVIVVDHVMTPVDHTKPVAPGTKTVTGKVIDGAHEADMNKTITRTINITNPHTGLSTQTQTVKLFRDAKYDEVTGKVTYVDWTTGNWAEVTVPTVDGYTPNQTSVAAETVTDQTDDSTVNITYTAGEQTVTIKFVDDNNGGQPVTSVTKAGQTGETINQLGLTMPIHYELAKGQTLPTSYTFTADKDQAITIHLIHATKTVDGNKPDTILSDVDKKQLIHTVTRTITDHVPGQEPLITKQSATITRRATYDEVTGKLSNFSDWTTAELPDYTAKGAAGYTASETDVPAETVTDQTDDSTVNITYTANNQTGKISYQDRNGKEIDSTSLSGKTDETVAINPQVPTGWKITDGQNIPKTVTATADGVPMVVVKIEHATTKVPHTDPVKPGAKTPTGKVIDGAHDADLNKTITRTINVTTPNGKITTTKQVANLYRDATYDDVTGEVAYDDWSTDIWKAFTPTAIPGYTVETVPMETVTADMSNKTVNVAYTASATKDAANKAIDDALTKKLDDIKANTKLTDDEKAKLTNDANTAANNAKAAIDAATKDADVTKAKNTGVDNINNVNVPTTSATKDAAKNAIDQAAKAKNNAIDASNLTDEEKADLKK